MVWFLYNTVFFVGYVLMLPRFFFRMWKRGGYRNGFLQRLGVYDVDVAKRLRERPRIWIHAVSVGEVLVAVRFMEELRAHDATCAFVLTTATPTGRAVAERRLLAGDVLLYFPADFPAVTRRALDAIRPTALLLTECELWPNLIRYAKRLGIPVVLINGRISDSSYRGYRKVGVFFRRLMPCLELLLVQTKDDKTRLQSLGADPSRLKVLGTAKYDVAREDDVAAGAARAFLDFCGFERDDLILVGGSTWPGEEDILLGLYKRLRKSCPTLRLVLVPRHAERRAEVGADIRRHGLTYVRRADVRSGDPAPTESPDVVLIDTTGEIMGYYACASVILVGKSLTSHGGQNIIEPALLGKPIVVGPNMENFPDVVRDFLSADALIQVRDEEELGGVLRRLFEDETEREAYGRRAAQVVAERRGVVRESVRLIRESQAWRCSAAAETTKTGV